MKNVTEWSTEFNIAYNNIMSNQAPGLNEYEKSVFLTRAEEDTVVGIYKGSIIVPFESTEEVTDYLSPLVAQANCSAVTGEVKHIVEGSAVYALPTDVLFRTYEKCVVSTDCGGVDANVVPVTQDEFWRTNRDPFKNGNKRRVLRLSYADTIMDSSALDHHLIYSELVSKYPIQSYMVRYIKRPEPIILQAIPEGYPSINGERAVKTCKLHENLHQLILMRAVELARAVWSDPK
jgi:hypothetical protein